MFSKVLLPVELNESLNDIKLRASFVVKLGAQDIILLHVLTPGLGGTGHAESRLRHFQEVLHEVGVTSHYHVEEGNVPGEITNVARDHEVDLIYIPASGKNFLLTSLVGSTTQDVIRLANRPVWVHKQRPFLKHKESMDKMIFATDFKHAAERCCFPVKELSRLIPELIVLHVGERAADPYSEQIRKEEVDNNLDKMSEYFRDSFTRVRAIARIGSPAKQILNVVEQEQVDLVVLGRINEPFPLNFLGSTCGRVTSGASSSVLLVP